MSDALALAAGLLAFLAAGDLTAGLLRPALAARGGGRLGIALLLGPGVVAWLLFTANLAGVPLAPLVCRTLAALVITVALLARWRAPRFPAAAGTARPASLALVLLVVVPVVIGAALAVALPPFKDALAIWSLKARVLYEDGTVRSADFLLPDRFHFHPSYPLLLPLAEAFLFGLRAGTPDDAAKVVLALPHLGAPLVVYAALVPRLGGRLPLAFAALTAAVPHFYRTDATFAFPGSVPSGYADPMLAGLIGATAAAALDALRPGGVRDGATAALCAGLAAFTKNEGLAFAGVVLVAVTLIARRRRPLAPGALLLGLVLLPWLLFRRTLPARDEDYLARLRPDVLHEHLWRAKTILVTAAEELVAVGRHGLVWPLLGLTVLLRPRRLVQREPLLLVLLLVGMALVYGAVFLVSPMATLEQLRTALPRTVFHLAVPALLLSGLLLAEPDAPAGGVA